MIYRIVLFLLLPLICFSWAAPVEAAKKGDYRYSLKSFKGKKNILLVFAPSRGDPRFKNQLENFEKQEKQLREAKIVLFYVFRDEEGRADDMKLRRVDSQSLRQDFKVGEKDFSLVYYSMGQKILKKQSEPQSIDAILKAFKS